MALWVIKVDMPQPTPTAPPAQTPSITDWISAVGGAIGALGTAGALWLGAVTFRRQVQDQHRAQAAAITVSISPIPNVTGRSWVEIRNDSREPIYGVALVLLNKAQREVYQEFFHAIPPGKPGDLSNLPGKLARRTRISRMAVAYRANLLRWVVVMFLVPRVNPPQKSRQPLSHALNAVRPPTTVGRGRPSHDCLAHCHPYLLRASHAG